MFIIIIVFNINLRKGLPIDIIIYIGKIMEYKHNIRTDRKV